MARLSSRGEVLRASLLAVFSAILVSLLLLSPAQARNVPGSSSAVQPLIDGAVSSSILDTAMSTARDAAIFESCQNFVRAPNAAEMRHPCEWGISFGGGVRYIEGSPKGYDFDFTSAFGSLVIAKSLGPSATLLTALIAETGNGDLHYNNGTLDNKGVGALVGGIFRLNDTLDLSVLGGVEWLNYETTRSFGQYQGEYDAIRYMIDAQLHGLYDGGSFFLDYGGGVRVVHQRNDGYVEYSSGLPFANVDSFETTIFTALADLKLGKKMGGYTPYVQATGYLSLFDNKGEVIGVDYENQSLFGRLGVGVDIDIPSGKLSLTTGVFAGEDGFQGADAAFKLVKTF